jgi:hypothetical protein
MDVSEVSDDIFGIFERFAKVAPTLTDFYFIFFVQYRNLVTGANTITKSGLTSPNSGLLKEWPGFGPNGVNLSGGSPGGSTAPVPINPIAPTPSQPVLVATFNGWNIYLLSNGNYQGTFTPAGGTTVTKVTPEENGIINVEKWILEQ